MSKKLTLFSKEYIDFNGIKTRDVTLDFNNIDISIMDGKYSLDQLYIERCIFLIQYIKSYLKIKHLKDLLKDKDKDKDKHQDSNSTPDNPIYDIYFWKSDNDARGNPLAIGIFRLGMRITKFKANDTKEENFIAFELPYNKDNNANLDFWKECSFANTIRASLQSFTSESIATDNSYARDFEDIKTSAFNFNAFLLEVIKYINLY